MRRVLLVVVVLAGCAGPENYRAYNQPLGTAVEREDDLKRNLRSDRSWEEQERSVSEIKGMFGLPADADSLGPASKPTRR